MPGKKKKEYKVGFHITILFHHKKPVHSFVSIFILFIALLLFPYNNKGSSFYIYFMALNGLSVPMSPNIKHPFIHSF